MITAKDMMTDDPVTLPVGATVRAAVEKLQTLDIRHLPIVDEEGELVGMVSDRDIRALTVPHLVGTDVLDEMRTALDAPIASIMTGAVLSVDTEADAAEVIDLMLDHKIGAVPVVDGDGVLVGIISYIDVLRTLSLDAAAQ